MTAYSAGAELAGAEGVSPSQLFVINLCASTSPMALSHPSSPELKRFTFFVSRQREEGRERFRLHMGYFTTQEQAEELLVAVRDVYPAAWAGPAPTTGVGRRARPTVAVVPVAPAAPVPVAAQAPVPVAAPAPVIAPEPAAVPVPAVEDPLAETLSNVRDVLAQLSEAPSATPPAAAQPELSDSQTLRVLEMPPAPVVAPAPVAPPARAAAPAAARAAPAVAPASAPPARAPAPPAAGDDTEVRLVTPEDTQTLTDIRIDAQNNAPPCFAVQLVWSVSPIDVSALPHLAIFDAYTLYNVEGSRQGRKWYGLRLGFFSDPNSATQVAQYVRSDYSAVAVVPVATRERDHARGGMPVAKGAAPRLGAADPAKAEPKGANAEEMLDGFQLLADDTPAPVKRDLDDRPAARAAATPPATRPAATKPPASVPKVMPVDAKRPAPPTATGKPTGKRVVVRKRPELNGRAAPGAPQPLESTLEILGASTLSLDEGREIINDSAVRKPVPKKAAGGNRFAKLLSRLSGG